MRTSRISLAVACGAALLVLIVWLLPTRARLDSAPQRSLVDVEVPWVCEKDANHQLTASGRYEPRTCPNCGGRCYIMLDYECPRHGRFDAMVKFEPPPAPPPLSLGRAPEWIIEYRLRQSSTWRRCDGTVPCPSPGCTELPRRTRSAWSPRRGG